MNKICHVIDQKVSTKNSRGEVVFVSAILAAKKLNHRVMLSLKHAARNQTVVFYSDLTLEPVIKTLV